MTARPPLAASLEDLLVECTVAAVLNELRERRERLRPDGDTTEAPDDPHDDADLRRDGHKLA